MKRTKSKLDLIDLQKQFDTLLEEFNVNEILSWKIRDMQVQGNLLFEGKVIEVDSNPISYVPISCSVEENNLYNSNKEIDYDAAA